MIEFGSMKSISQELYNLVLDADQGLGVENRQPRDQVWAIEDTKRDIVVRLGAMIEETVISKLAHHTSRIRLAF